MAEITARLVKRLREKTGAGMMDCKKALGETDGDLEAAVDWLRKKGLAKAAPRRPAASPPRAWSAVRRRGRQGRRRRGQLRDRLRRPQREVPGLRQRRVASWRCKSGRRRGAGQEAVPRRQRQAVADKLTDLIATIGENMSLRRMAALSSADHGVVAAYVHNALAPRHGQDRRAGGAGVDAATRASWRPLGKQLAMHVAAANPAGADVGCRRPAAAIERERAVLAEQGQGLRQAGGGHRQDGRRRPAQVLRGGRAAGADLRHRRREPR